MFDHKRRDDVSDDQVTSLLQAAAAPTEPGPLPGEEEALAAFRASQTSPRRPTVMSHRTTARSALAAAVGAGVLFTGGIAAAATGTLPGAAQDTARDMLGVVGVEVPGPAEQSAGHADQRGASGDAPAEDSLETGETTTDDDTPDAGESTDATTGHDQGRGDEVSTLARSEELSGREKGAAVSELASQGKSQAGDEHGKADESARADNGETDTDDEGDGAGESDSAPEPTADDREDARTQGETRSTEARTQAEQQRADSGDDDTTAEETSGAGAGGAANRR